MIGGLLLLNAQQTLGVVPAVALTVLAGTFTEGTVVGTAQWLVLRRPLESIRWRIWVLATALAWMVGMVSVFVGINFIPSGGSTISVSLMLLLFLFVAGASVGAVHGLVLIWLLRSCSQMIVDTEIRT